MSEPAQVEPIAKPKPTKVLPTARISFAKQIDMLRAFGASYTTDAKPVTSVAVAKLVSIHESTARLANPFWLDIGLLQKSETGFVPNQDVTAMHRARAFNSEAPERRLYPSFKDTWFARALTTKLAFHGGIEENEAVTILAEACAATPDNRGQIEILIDYLALAGVVERDGTGLRASREIPARDITVVPAASLSPVVVQMPDVAVPNGRTVEQHLLDILDVDAMSDDEQSAVWVLLKYLKKKKA